MGTSQYFLDIEDVSALEIGKRQRLCVAVNTTEVAATYMNVESIQTALQDGTINADPGFQHINDTLIGAVDGYDLTVYLNFAYGFEKTVYLVFPPSRIITISELRLAGLNPIWTGLGWTWTDSSALNGTNFTEPGYNQTLSYHNLTSSMNFSQSSTVLDGNITQRVRFKCDGCTTSESEGKSVIYVGKRCESSVKDGGMLAVS